ncbi:MAG: hypothetical protein ACUVWN_10860 [bacterium]
MKKCYKVKNLFGPYIYNIATNEERDIVENHIKNCSKCANDLRTRQTILKRAIAILPTDNKISIQDERFTENVYKRLALEFLNHQSKQLFIKKYILRPSFAVAIAVIGIMFGMSRLNSPVLVKSTEVQIPKATESRLIEEKAYTQAKINNNKTKPKVKSKSYANSDIQSTTLVSQKDLAYSDTITKLNDTSVIQSDDLLERLTDANMINYSLGDRRRAIAEYQRIIDDYPNTNAAIEAQNLIKVIMESEMKISEEYIGEGKSIDKGI